MGPLIRPFINEDYPAIVDIGNSVYPEYPGTPEEARFGDEHRDPKCKFQRWVAEHGGDVIAVAEYGQHAEMFHARKFWIGITVRPVNQGQRVGAALYHHLLNALQPFDPILVRVGGVREDMPRSIRFLADRGFREAERGWESRLDVKAFDPAPYDGVDSKVAAIGIEIATMRGLESDPDRDRKLYELEMELARDVPQPEPFTPVTFTHFRERTLGDPNLLPDAYFVAIHGGAYVGQSTLWKSQANTDLYVGLTAVKRDYRRKGIALALKLRAIAWAREHGHPLLKTWNESNNRAMLSINERLGFVKQPAWISYVKVLREEGT